MMTERRGDDEGPLGILNDWDHARPIDAERSKRVVCATSTLVHIHLTSRIQGTWYFMSFLLLVNPSRPHDLFDDLESLLWVLLFLAVRRFKYRGDFDMQVFEEAREIPDEEQGIVSVGGSSKHLWLSRPGITF